jgi:autophagy-related protein 5
LLFPLPSAYFKAQLNTQQHLLSLLYLDLPIFHTHPPHAMSEEILSRIASSKINCSIIHRDPETILRRTFLINIPRNAYLYSYLPQIFHFFGFKEKSLRYAHFTTLENEYVEWNTPIDTIANLSGSEVLNMFIVTVNESATPDNLKQFHDRVHHFEDIPTFFEKYWHSKVKEACYILNKSSNLVLSMSLRDSKQFWHSAQIQPPSLPPLEYPLSPYSPSSPSAHPRYKIFERYFHRILPSNFKGLPIIIHFKDVPQDEISESAKYAIYSYAANSTYRLQLNLQLDPETLNGMTLLSMYEHLGIPPPPMTKCHGITIPHDSPLVELYTLLKHSDLFLHIVHVNKNY